MEREHITIENEKRQAEEFVIFEYENHVEIERYLSKQIEIVDIPKTINGKPVTTICDGCFFNSVDICQVNLPDTISVIGIQAFAMCRGLTEMSLPDSVNEIGHHAFRDCRSLKKVVLPKNLKRIPEGLFSFCNLQNPEIVLPDGLEIIENGAFWSAGSFDLLIPNSVKEIGVGAFNWGPHPITTLPEDKGWYLEWPYGETVECSGERGIITDILYLEDDCRLNEVQTVAGVKTCFYPCDYLDEIVTFVDENNKQRMRDDIELGWGKDNKLANAFEIRELWKRGLVAPKS